MNERNDVVGCRIELHFLLSLSKMFNPKCALNFTNQHFTSNDEEEIEINRMRLEQIRGGEAS